MDCSSSEYFVTCKIEMLYVKFNLKEINVDGGSKSLAVIFDFRISQCNVATQLT